MDRVSVKEVNEGFGDVITRRMAMLRRLQESEMVAARVAGSRFLHFYRWTPTPTFWRNLAAFQPGGGKRR